MTILGTEVEIVVRIRTFALILQDRMMMLILLFMGVLTEVAEAVSASATFRLIDERLE